MKTSILTGLCLSAVLSLILNNYPATVQLPVSPEAATSITGSFYPTVCRPDTNPETHQFEKVEVEARFNGGEEAWRKYIGANLNPEVPVKKKAPVGVYPVVIQFVVKKDGTVGDIVAKTSFGYGMEEEAIRVILASPRWKPARQNGTTVNAFRLQPITFEVVEEKRKRRKKDD